MLPTLSDKFTSPALRPLDQRSLEVRGTYYLDIFNSRFFTTGPHAWISFLFLPSKFHIIFILSPTVFLLRFCFTFIFIYSRNLSWNFTEFSAHNVRFGSNILTHLQSGYHLFLILFQVYKSSFHRVVQSNIKGTLM